jgi:predicted transcriptional regulator
MYNRDNIHSQNKHQKNIEVILSYGENTVSKKRSKFQIAINILQAIAGGKYRPSWLMYECNISWKSLTEFLDFLESKGYIIEDSRGDKRKQFFVTSSGREILRYCSGLQNLIQI